MSTKQFRIKEDGLIELTSLISSLSSTLVSLNEKYMSLAHIADTKAYRDHEEMQFTINGLKTKSQSFINTLEYIKSNPEEAVLTDHDLKMIYIRCGKVWGYTEHLYAMAFGQMISITSPEDNHKALCEIVEKNEQTLPQQKLQLG